MVFGKGEGRRGKGEGREDPSPSPIAKLDTRHINRGPRKEVCEAGPQTVGWHSLYRMSYLNKGENNWRPLYEKTERKG